MGMELQMLLLMQYHKLNINIQNLLQLVLGPFLLLSINNVCTAINPSCVHVFYTINTIVGLTHIKLGHGGVKVAMTSPWIKKSTGRPLQIVPWNIS